MTTSVRLSASLACAFVLAGCGQASPPRQAADIVFAISLAPSLPDGRPVIDIKPNGRPRPIGTAPSGSYFLMTRRNGQSYYTRWFSPQEAETGTRYDLAIPDNPAIPDFDLKPGDKLTVGVENIITPDGSDYVQLSNVLDLPWPPPSGPPSQPTPNGPM